MNDHTIIEPYTEGNRNELLAEARRVAGILDVQTIEEHSFGFVVGDGPGLSFDVLQDGTICLMVDGGYPMYLKGGDANIETKYGWVQITGGRLESLNTGLFERTDKGCFVV